MWIADDNGELHVLTTKTVNIMLAIGWTSFITAWIVNIAIYKVSFMSLLLLHDEYLNLNLQRSILRRWTWTSVGGETKWSYISWVENMKNHQGWMKVKIHVYND